MERVNRRKKRKLEELISELNLLKKVKDIPFGIFISRSIDFKTGEPATMEQLDEWISNTEKKNKTQRKYH